MSIPPPARPPVLRETGCDSPSMFDKIRMTRNGWPSIASTYLFNLLGIVTFVRMIPLQGDIITKLQVTPAQFGWLLGLSGLAPTVLATVCGEIADRVGARRMLLIGGSITTCTSVAYVMASSYTAFIVIRLTEGLALVALFTGVPVMNLQITDRKRQNVAISVWSTGQPIGVFIAFSIGGFFARTPHWPATLLLFGAVALLLACTALFLPQIDSPVSRPGMTFGQLIHGFRQMGPVRLSISLFVLTSCQLGTQSITAAFLVGAHEISIAAATSLVGSCNLVMIPGALLTGVLLSKGVSRFRICAAYILAACTFGTVMFIPTVPMAGVTIALGGWFGTLGALAALLWNTLARVANPNYPGQAAGVMNQAGSLAILIMPSVWLTLSGKGLWTCIIALNFVSWGIGLAMFLSLRKLISAEQLS
jgi:predicted MFS family arabinose efflux permease